MNRPRLLLILAALFCALNLAAQNQSLDALRDEIRRAEEEIRATNELLAKTKKDKQVTQNQLKLIQNRIRNRKQIIANLEKQTQVINGDIGTKNDTVHAMQNELTQLRKEYADMVYAAYKNYKLNNFLVFLFASKDFNDATRRISYMRRYNRMRQQKAEQIKSVADSLHVQIGELENRKAELTKVRDTRTQEVSSLGKDEKQYQSSLSEINTKSGKLSSEIRKKQSQINKLQQRIQKEQVKYEPARHISKTLNEIDGMGQKTFTGKMAISKEDYSQLTALAKEGITSRAEIKSLEQNANYYRQKYFDSANALERMKTKYNELKEKCRPFLEALEHFPEVAKLFTEKVRQLFSFKEAQERAEKEARDKERQERIKARKNKRGMER